MTIPLNFNEANEAALLISSYNAIQDKSQLEIIIDNTAKNEITKLIVENLSLDLTYGAFSIQNLFKIQKPSGIFYICQCLFDFGLNFGGGKYDRSFRHRYNYDTIGFGITKVDLGKTILRPKTFADKLVGHFIHSTIQINDCKTFNERFCIVSDRKDNIEKYFDSDFVNTICKYEGLNLIINESKLFLSFENHMEEKQARAVEDIFSSFKYWSE